MTFVLFCLAAVLAFLLSIALGTFFGHLFDWLAQFVINLKRKINVRKYESD